MKIMGKYEIKIVINSVQVLSDFLLPILLFLSMTNPGLRYFYICSYSDMGCSMIEVNSF
jgi:hypothetical protein